MKLGIGIDTGGTYTDAVIYDFHNKKVLCAAKALTTKDDLSIGILNALDGLDPNLLQKAEIVSLSTTLATNACVENKGGRAKLLFIGVDRDIAEMVGRECGLTDMSQIYFLDAEITIEGKINKAPDWDAFLEESKEWFKDAEALGIVQLNAMSSGAVLEKEAKELIKKNYNIPVVCGHELFSDLNSIKRGASALLNGRLIPVLEEFLAAIKKALRKRNITAPIAIVRSDGSLMSDEFAEMHPVETIFCGPSASVIGGVALTGENQAVIVDMGGTTTDIGLVRNGMPVKTRDGINIGNWRTFVKGFYVETIGLGGDSAVRYDRYGQLILDTVRVIPISIAADRWPEIIPKLQDLLKVKERHSQLLHEFFTLVKDISGSSLYTEEEKQFCEALKKGPLIYSEAAAAIGRDIYSFKVDRLEKEGIVMRCGLTPTDIMHIKGDFNRYCVTAAELAAQFLASCTGMSVEELCDKVYYMIKKKLYLNIAGILLKESMPEFQDTGLCNELKAFINRAWEISQGEKSEHLKFGFTTSSVLIGVGAPIHIFLPDVARALGTKCIIPENAGVVNAVGAVAGNVSASCTLEVRPMSDKFVIYGASNNCLFSELEEATAAACEEASRLAREEALNRGACGDVIVKTEINPVVAMTGYGTEVFLKNIIVATAVGKITL